MFYRVRKAFKYKPTGKRYLPDSEFETLDPECVKRLRARGFIHGKPIRGSAESIDIKEIKKTTDLAPPGPPPEPPPEPHEYTVAELKHVGGGWWELPDGSRVQGKAAALEALADLAFLMGDDADVAREP